MVSVYPVVIRKTFESAKADFCEQVVSDNRVGFMPADKAGSFIGTNER